MDTPQVRNETRKTTPPANWSGVEAISDAALKTPSAPSEPQQEPVPEDEKKGSTGASNLFHLIRAAEIANDEIHDRKHVGEQDEKDAVGAFIKAEETDVIAGISTKYYATEPRKGKWSEEEQQYTVAIVKYFQEGLLNIAAGTTLRSYLAEKLQCDPMRVSKKLSGSHFGGMEIPKKLGKRTYIPSRKSVEKTHLVQITTELKRLERAFLRKVEEEIRLEQSASRVLKRKKKMEMVKKLERCGPWAAEEEAYAISLVHYFLDGLLPISPGTTLRSFLAEQLRCDPMRISKKLSSAKLGRYDIPKRVGTKSFSPKQGGPDVQAQFDAAQAKLTELRDSFYFATGLSPIPKCDVNAETTHPESPTADEQRETIARRKRTISDGSMSPTQPTRTLPQALETTTDEPNTKKRCPGLSLFTDTRKTSLV